MLCVLFRVNLTIAEGEVVELEKIECNFLAPEESLQCWPRDWDAYGVSLCTRQLRMAYIYAQFETNYLIIRPVVETIPTPKGWQLKTATTTKTMTNFVHTTRWQHTIPPTPQRRISNLYAVAKKTHGVFFISSEHSTWTSSQIKNNNSNFGVVRQRIFLQDPPKFVLGFTHIENAYQQVHTSHHVVTLEYRIYLYYIL